MPPRKIPLWQIWLDDDNHISKQILRELELYAKDKGFYPLQNVLFTMLTNGRYNPVTHKWEPARYSFEIGTYNYWFKRLVEEGYVGLDPDSRSINSTSLEIREKEIRKADLD